ncbi:MAG: exodeoxyribonuclease VII large subunit [Muribaculaceae bacterium]|nr:exodeoxyribonuclease VII large subunit [Muribaculaceae bacterium]
MTRNLFDNTNDFPLGIPLSKFTAAITNTVASSPDLAGVWITAELSDVRVAGGHCYMELIEKNENGQTIAKLRANIWRNSFIQLRQKFLAATQREISNGIKALIKGSATHHSIYGLSFNIIDIDPSYTMGDMERIRREILFRLKKEGIAEHNKSLLFPQAPQRIAVISAQGAAGYGDFINHLLGNSEGFVFYPVLFPCVMQGENVSVSIRHALNKIYSSLTQWDCVAIVRGGGATTDLNGFDDYELARAVATFPLPVVVGIGHERDRNVLDEIANISLKTPTAVAGFFIDQLRFAFDRIISIADRLRIYSTEAIRGEERRLSSIHTLIPQLVLRRMAFNENKLKNISMKLPLVTQARIEKEIMRFDNYKTLLFNAISSVIEKNNQKIYNLESLVKILDPKNTLLRGYSITRINGKAIKSVRNIKPGDIVKTTLPDGEFESSCH